MKRFIVLFVFILCLTSSNYVFPNDTIVGNCFVNNYSTENFELQNWAIVQDNRGVMYFGNGAGVLEFDGKNWKAIKTSNNSTVRSLDIDKNGTIFVGASGEFGYLDIDSTGNIYYKSLLSKITDSVSEIKRILKTFCTTKGVYFISEDNIFRYYNNQIIVIPAKLSGQQRYGFNINDQIFIIQEDVGLCYINENEIIPLPHTSRFSKDYGRYVILPYTDNNLLIATQDKGLFTYNLNMISHHGKIFPDNNEKNTAPQITQNLPSPIAKYIEANGLYSASKVDSNLYAFGTIGGGIILMNSRAEFVQIINKEKSLRGNSILDLYLDNTNNLWAALQDGISLIEINNPIHFFNESNKLEGILLNTIEFNGVRYAGTHLGIYYLKPYRFSLENDNYEFVLVENGKSTCLDLFVYNNHLLASTSQGIMEIKNKKAEIIQEDLSPYCFHSSKKFNDLIFLGSSNGLSYLKVNPNTLKIRENFTFPEITNAIIEMVDDNNGDLWLTTQFNGIIHLEFEENNEKNYSISRYDTAQGLPSLNLNYVHFINNNFLVATQNGVYSSDKKDNQLRFIPDTTYCSHSINKECSVSKLIEHKNNKSFVLSENLGIGILDLIQKELYVNPFKKIAPESIYNLFLEDDFSWICTTDGLYKYDLKSTKTYNQSFNSLIRKVVFGKDSLLYGGTALKDTTRSIPNLLYKHNSILFEYYAPFYENSEDIKFQYKLEGFDEEWSDWISKTEKSYTNLWEGEYTFLVKAKNIYGIESKIASYSFEITPPWYRTYLAYAGYILLLGFTFYIGFRLYARRLVEQNIKLEKIIKERTAEIRKQRDQIADQKQSITDSIHYASRIQNAILPPNEFISKHLAEFFILFKPRDIVSGDFYWFTENESKVIITAADCTGHGVPGAFMSMLGISFLNEIVNKEKIISANEILNELRDHVKTSLHQTGKSNESKDGMDMALCVIDKENMTIDFAGANNPLYLIRDGELIQYKADRMPIGIYIKDNLPFTNHLVDVQKDDIVYIFSDGYVDQFGGDKGKKFMPKNFKALLLEHHQKPMEYQKEMLDQTIEFWKGDTEQVDDILVIGIKIT
jgi:serine phosphatase RsbU (regulator of sigma subunit)